MVLKNMKRIFVLVIIVGLLLCSSADDEEEEKPEEENPDGESPSEPVSVKIGDFV